MLSSALCLDAGLYRCPWRRIHPAEPRLPPVGGDLAWTQPARWTAFAAAHDSLEDEAVTLDLDHSAGLLVDDAFNSRFDSVDAAAVRAHLAIEPESPVLASDRK